MSTGRPSSLPFLAAGIRLIPDVHWFAVMPRCPLGRAGWCGLCYELVRGRRSSHSHFVSPHTRSNRMKRPGHDPLSNGKPQLSFGVVERQYPDLATFMTDEHWDDGTARPLPTLMLFVDDGIWKLWLNDKALNVSAWLTGEDIASVLLAADLGLKSASLTWRRPKGRSSGSNRRP